MVVTIAGRTRSRSPLAGVPLFLSLLVLSACGGGGGGQGSGANFSPSCTPSCPPGGGAGSGASSVPATSKLTVSTLAGTANPGADGIGAAARFSLPGGVASDGANLYVADTSNNTIRKIVIATGVVTTLAGQVGVTGAADGTGAAATFSGPTGVATDGTNVYVADAGNNKIRQVAIATGAVTTLAGSGAAGAADGAGASASFSSPQGIATDGTSVYVADRLNNKIRSVVIATGAVSSLTGTANAKIAAGAADGAAASASFNFPYGIAIDSAKTSLYVADSGNNKIRQVAIATGAVSSLSGTANTAGTLGAADGAAASASFFSPQAISTDGVNLYVADTLNNKIRQVTIATGAVTSATGTANAAGAAGYADGAASGALFSSPAGIAVAGTALYVLDTNNSVARQIAGGVVSTVAGNATPGADGTGAAAKFQRPWGAVAAGNKIYVADTFNNTIRQIVISTGAVSTLAGQVGVAGAADGTGPAATFNRPADLTTDGTNLYVTDYGNNKIRMVVIATGVVSSVTGTSGVAVAAGAADGAAASATFKNPAGIASDGKNLYVADSGNNKIRQVVIATGVVSSLTGASNTAVPSGAADGAAATASFSLPQGITTNGTNLYITDSGNNKIRKLVIATGAVSSLTGAANTAVIAGAADGAAASASFSLPQGISNDGTNLYVADTYNNKIRKVVAATGVVSSVTGVANAAGAVGYADGAAAAATFYYPVGITNIGVKLYVTDQLNHTIRAIQ